MTQTFLNEPTIEGAHSKYLERWSNPAVQKSWKGRKPSLRQFEARFGEAHIARQAFLDSVGSVKTEVMDDRHMDDVQEVAEAINEALANLSPPRFAELSADPEPEPEETSEPEARTVKPQNFDKLPNSRQLYFYLHRAIDAGFSFVTIPVKRGVAAEGITLIKDGKSPIDAILDLRKKYPAK